MSRRSTIVVGALAFAGALFFFLILPHAPGRVDTTAWADLGKRTVAGAYHIHTTRSDGAGDKHDVAAAARRAGLRFAILTDHGDATRPPDPPEYIDGVLCLDAVEISTDGGHYVALDMPRAPYPLGGATDTVIEDVARLGGFGIVAHPDSPKTALRWRGGYDGVDGIEWLNADSEWRKDSRRRLVRAALSYLVRPGPALITLFDRPATLDRWDGLTGERALVGLAAADAHGGMQSRPEPEKGSGTGIRGLPGYEASFRAFSNRVVLGSSPTGDAAADARAVYGAIRHGRVFAAIDAIAAPALLDFHLELGQERFEMGSRVPAGAGGTLVARAPLPARGELVLLHDGRELARSSSGALRSIVEGGRGAYRVEARAPGSPGHPPIPWLVSNPIYFFPSPVRVPEAPASGAVEGDIAPFPWRIEKDPTSSAILRTGDHTVDLQYTLGREGRTQVVALATDLQHAAFRAIRVGLAADRPMRVSIQLRRADGRRWGRSVYVDSTPRTVLVAAADLKPVGEEGPAAIDSRDATSLLLVIDLTNAAPGHPGILRVLASAIVQ